MKLIDRYVFNARFLPAASVLLPAGAAVAAWLPKPDDLVSGGQLVAMGLSAGGAMLLSQLGQGPGKSKEPSLFSGWGGQPSAAMLRHRDVQLDPRTKARYHRKLSRLVTDSAAPTAVQEDADPADADSTYLSWVSYLRSHTRDPEQFRMLLASNIDYGFRRNLWGMKPAGIFVAVLGTLATTSRLGWIFWSTRTVDFVALAALIFNVWMLVVWVATINSTWVRIVARTYAEQLLATSDVLEPPASAVEPESARNTR